MCGTEEFFCDLSLVQKKPLTLVAMEVEALRTYWNLCSPLPSSTMSSSESFLETNDDVDACNADSLSPLSKDSTFAKTSASLLAPIVVRFGCDELRLPPALKLSVWCGLLLLLWW